MAEDLSVGHSIVRTPHGCKARCNLLAQLREGQRSAVPTYHLVDDDDQEETLATETDTGTDSDSDEDGRSKKRPAPCF